jgi:hypothetical protein
MEGPIPHCLIRKSEDVDTICHSKIDGLPEQIHAAEVQEYDSQYPLQIEQSTFLFSTHSPSILVNFSK